MRFISVLLCWVVGIPMVATAQSSGTFTSTGRMIVARSQHSATLLPDGRVLIAGGASSNLSLASTEIYDPAGGTFRAATPMITARRGHTATLLPDDRVLIVGGYGYGGALASAELYDPVTGTFSPTGELTTARAGHSAILLSTGKVLIIGGYGSNAYPNVAPAELYDPVSGTFASAGAYVGHDGCDFCAPSILLSDGAVLFPGQYPAQLYDPASDAFSPIGMMIHDQSTGAVLTNGQALFAGGEGLGRLADAELYNPLTRTFAPTGSMASRRVWHSLNLLPDGMVLAAGGETESCAGFGCLFAGSLDTAELYDPSAGAFYETGSMTAARETHTATLLKDGTVLIAGGVSYGGIGIFGGSLASAEVYTPVVLIPAPALVSLSGDGQGQGAIFHAGTRDVAAPDDPAVAGENVDIYCTGLPTDSVLLPQVAIGGRIAALVGVSTVPGLAGASEVRVRVPSGIAGGPAVRVRLTYLDRPSNEVTMAAR
jgi:galactose oxidase-like protein